MARGRVARVTWQVMTDHLFPERDLWDARWRDEETCHAALSRDFWDLLVPKIGGFLLVSLQTNAQKGSNSKRKGAMTMC